MNLLPGLVIGIDFKLSGNLFSLNVGTFIFRCDVIPDLIFNDFLVDLSIIEANPKSLALAFFRICFYNR